MGTMPPETTLDTIYSAVAKGAQDANGIDAGIVSSDQDACYMSVICFKEDARHVEDALRAAGFTRLAPGIAKTPAEQAADIDAEIKETAASTAELREKIAAYASSRGELRIAADYCRAILDFILFDADKLTCCLFGQRDRKSVVRERV